MTARAWIDARADYHRRDQEHDTRGYLVTRVCKLCGDTYSTVPDDEQPPICQGCWVEAEQGYTVAP